MPLFTDNKDRFGQYFVMCQFERIIAICSRGREGLLHIFNALRIFRTDQYSGVCVCVCVKRLVPMDIGLEFEVSGSASGLKIDLLCGGTWFDSLQFNYARGLIES